VQKSLFATVSIYFFAFRVSLSAVILFYVIFLHRRRAAIFSDLPVEADGRIPPDHCKNSYFSGRYTRKRKVTWSLESA
jgi:hypothetical protein